MIVHETPSAEQVEECVRGTWSFDAALPVPHEGVLLLCGTCGADALIARSWRYFTRAGALNPTHPYRCDIAAKCGCCSALTWFGVVVPRDVWRQIPAALKGVSVTRKEAIRHGWLSQPVGSLLSGAAAEEV